MRPRHAERPPTVRIDAISPGVRTACALQFARVEGQRCARAPPKSLKFGLHRRLGTPQARPLALAQMSLAMATAVSAMRLEKPHSLSYQLITDTITPSITLVWSIWKIDEAGSWLKSDDTLG
jgi:hypothetical protein